MGGKPGAVSGGQVPYHRFGIAGRSKAIDVGRYLCGPAAGIVISLSDPLPRFLQRADVVHHRRHAFIQVGQVRRPVVHLDVDVIVVVGVPGALYLVAPDTLKVGWHVALAAGCNQQIPPELEIQNLQPQIRIPFTVPVQSVRCWKIRSRWTILSGRHIRLFVRGFAPNVPCGSRPIDIAALRLRPGLRRAL